MTDDLAFSLVYEELRSLASQRLANERNSQDLSTTVLVHEAWAKLAGATMVWNDKSHFLRLASIAIRRILIDLARQRITEKRGGKHVRVPLRDVASPTRPEEILALDDALALLAESKPHHAKLVELRFFGGLTGDEAASVLGVSPATADRMWRYARSWLQIAMDKNQERIT